MVLKRVTKPRPKDRYETAVIVVDCGKPMGQQEEGGQTAMDLARQVGDWILSRKIFAQAYSKFIICLVGADGKKKIVLSSDQFETASFEQLRFLYENATLNHNTNGDVIDGVKEALTLFKMLTWDSGEGDDEPDPEVESRHLIVLTNGQSSTSHWKKAEQLAEDIKQHDINFVVMGVDDSAEHDATSSASVLCNVAAQNDAMVYTFDNSMSALSHYLSRNVAGRPSKKQLEIAPGIALPLTVHVHTQPGKNPIRAALADDQGNEMDRNREYVAHTALKKEEDAEGGTGTSTEKETETVSIHVKKGNGVQKKAGADDEFEEDDEPAKPVLTKKYYFGKDLVEVGDDAIPENKHNFNEGQKGGCLKLICFIDKKQIHPNYLMNNTTHVAVPTCAGDDPESKLTISLITSMLEDNTVALCRYAYHASANITPMFLFPERDEAGHHYFRFVQAPFYQSMNNITFTDLQQNTNKPTDLQKQLMNELIDAFDMSKNESINFDSEDVLNPKFQRMCQAVKLKALGQITNVNEEDAEESLKMDCFTQRKLNQNEKVQGEAREIFENLKKELALTVVPKAARRSLNRLPATQNEDAEMEEIEGEIEGERTNGDVQIEEQPAQENMNLVVKKENDANDEIDEQALDEMSQLLRKEIEQRGIEAVETFIQKVGHKVDFVRTVPDHFKLYIYKTISAEIQVLCKQVSASDKADLVKRYNDFLLQMKTSPLYAEYLDWVLDTDEDDGHRISVITKLMHRSSPYKQSEMYTFWLDVLSVKQEIKEERASIGSMA